MDQGLRFRSAVGWSFKLPALLVGVTLIASQSRGLDIVSLVVIGSALALIGWLYVSTLYTVTDRGLRVQSGPVNRWLDARVLERVRPTRTILSAPALSLDRLEVSGGFGSIVVSPRDKVGFVRALKRVAPQLRVEGGLDPLPPADMPDAGSSNDPRASGLAPLQSSRRFSPSCEATKPSRS
jgi:hypothetical protein